MAARLGLAGYLDRVGSHPLLTAAEEVELAKRVERGDREARERMIESNLLLVVSIARRYAWRGTPLDDLIQDGTIGLTHAVDKFDWRRGFRFSTYAYRWILQSILIASDDAIGVPVSLVRRRRKLQEASRRFEAETGRRPTMRELAKATGVSLREIIEALSYPSIVASLDQELPDGEPFGALLPDGTDVAEEATLAACADQVRDALAGLPVEQRAVVELRHGLDGHGVDGLPLREVACELGLSHERVMQVERAALTELRSVLSDRI